MATSDRGFASMSKDKQRKIASLGGKAAHAKGTAHEWTSDEASAAGAKGGVISAQNRAARRAAQRGIRHSDAPVDPDRG